MASPFIGEIRMFGGNFAPRGNALCDGQVISIAQNTALFSLLGTTYGGDGRTTFGLPDLRSRTPMHPGNGPGLTPRVLGEDGGAETVTLLSSQIPLHTHTVNGVAANGNQTSPAGAAWAQVAAGRNPSPRYTAVANTTLNPGAIGIAGGSQPHNNMQPYLAITFIIALQGIFPPRN